MRDVDPLVWKLPDTMEIDQCQEAATATMKSHLVQVSRGRNVIFSRTGDRGIMKNKP